MKEEGAIEPDEPKPDRFMQHDRMKFPTREKVTPSHTTMQKKLLQRRLTKRRKQNSSQTMVGFGEKMQVKR